MQIATRYFQAAKQEQKDFSFLFLEPEPLARNYSIRRALFSNSHQIKVDISRIDSCVYVCVRSLSAVLRPCTRPVPAATSTASQTEAQREVLAKSRQRNGQPFCVSAIRTLTSFEKKRRDELCCCSRRTSFPHPFPIIKMNEDR